VDTVGNAFVAFVALLSVFFVVHVAGASPDANDAYGNSSYYADDVDVVELNLGSGTRVCFETRHSRPNVPKVFLKSEIPLEVIYSWDSQRMMTLAFGILLSEKLGYDVVYKSWDKDGGQQLLEGHTVAARAYENVLRGKSMFNLELWPVSGAAGKAHAIDFGAEQKSTFSFEGDLGHIARNGWFVGASATDGPSTWHSLSLLNLTGAFDTSSSRKLMLSSELTVKDLRTSTREADKALCTATTTTLSWYGGTLDCQTGSWAPSNPGCCTRYLSRTTSCTQNCFALLVESPTWLKSENERRVASSGLPLEIVYGDVLATADWAAQTTASGTPSAVLFQWWEPDLNISPQKYIRITLRDTLYCSQSYMGVDGNTVTPSQNSFSYEFTSYSSPSACEFEREILEKGAHSPSETSFSDAFNLFDGLKFSFVDVQAILKLQSDYAADYSNQADREFAAACAWLKANEDNWSAYIKPEGFVFASLPYVCAAVALMIVYISVQQYILFKNGSYYQTEKQRSKEVLAAIESNPIFMLDVMDHKDSHRLDLGRSASPVAGLPELSFKLRELHVGDDESVVVFTITRNASGPMSSCYSEMYIYSEVSALDVDYKLPLKSGKGPGKLYEHTPGSAKMCVEFEAGQTEMHVELPLLRNPCWMPRRSLFVCMSPTESANVAPIDHLGIYVHQMGYFPRDYRIKSDSEKKGFKKVLKFMLSFLRETKYMPWISSMVWRYQLVYFIMAGLDTFAWSKMFSLLVNEGLLKSRVDYCVLVAMVFIAIELFRYHIGLHYFPGSYVLQTHLECLLGSKFSSLSVNDLASIDSVESLFRVSAATDTHSIRFDLWAKLHASIIEVYRLIGASLFIFYSLSDEVAIVGIVFGLMVFFFCASFAFISMRIRASYMAGIAEDELEVMVYESNHYVYRNTEIVRESRTETKTALRQYEKLWLFLDGGLFERWYQDYFNKWVLMAVLTGVLACLYALAPAVMSITGASVGVYVALIGSISQLGNAVIFISESFAIMLACVSKVSQMSDLLNIRSTRRRRIDALHKKYTDDDDDSRYERNHERIALGQIHPSVEAVDVIHIHDLTTIKNHPDERNTTKPMTLFNGLNAFDENHSVIHNIQAGGFIGVRRTRGTFSSTLMNVLIGTDVPYTGVATLNPSFDYVARMVATKSSILMNEHFQENLTLNLTLERSRLPPKCHRARRVAALQRYYDSRMLYKLCEIVKLTPSILGDGYREDWGTVSMSAVSSILDPLTEFQLTLIQALVADPDVILIDGFGDRMTFDLLQQVTEILRLWLHRRLPVVDDVIPDAPPKKTPRTVIWHGTPFVLLSTLKEDELVLNIKSKSEMSVLPVSVAFGGVKLSDFAESMQGIGPDDDIVNPVWRNVSNMSMRCSGAMKSLMDGYTPLDLLHSASIFRYMSRKGSSLISTRELAAKHLKKERRR